jgi:hypothetical protein
MFLDIDEGVFIKGTYRGELLDEVIDSDPDYVVFILKKYSEQMSDEEKTVLAHAVPTRSMRCQTMGCCLKL